MLSILFNNSTKIVIFCLLTASRISAQGEFAVSKIAPDLLNSADVVVRLDETVWEVVSKSEARFRSRYVATIFNEKGENAVGQRWVSYDKFTKIIDISGNLYDAEGKLLKKLKNSDISDYGYGMSGDNISDARMKLAEFGKKAYSYPYTVEYTCETRDRNMMFFPRWMPLSSPGRAVEQSTYRIKAPAGFAFRFKGYNGAPEVVKSRAEDGSDIYEWSIKNQTAPGKTDQFSLPLTDRTPMVVVAPSDFEVQGYQGNFKSWEDLSKFYHTLNAGRDVLPAATIAEIQRTVGEAKTDHEKIRRIYKWMQGRSRYVSIQLGIGGWQTIDAATVAAKGYGDCKALTNFTLAALRSAGVTCYPALIRAGREEQIKPDFPSSQFNHVIACALAGKDTLWLECTSQTADINFPGTFTGGREALLVLPEGGKLVRTPGYQSATNTRNSRAIVNLNDTGDGVVEVNVRYAGILQESRERILHGSTKEEQKNWLLEHINLPSLDLQKFELLKETENEPAIYEKLTLNVRNCATRTGTRLFVKPTLLSRPLELPATTERTADFYLPVSDYNFTDMDTTTYEIPAVYKLETTLPASKISSKFGSYELKTTLESNRLICSRKVIINGGKYESQDFQAWVDFVKKIRKADRAQVVFIENK